MQDAPHHHGNDEEKQLGALEGMEKPNSETLALYELYTPIPKLF